MLIDNTLICGEEARGSVLVVNNENIYIVNMLIEIHTHLKRGSKVVLS